MNSFTPTDQFSTTEPAIALKSRMRRMIEGAAATTLNKGVLILVNLVSIPIMVRYLGAERFGVWVTISTALAMLLVLDLGIANSLTNFISDAFAKDHRENASMYATTAVTIMTGVSLILGLIAWFVWPHLSWAAFFHLPDASQGPVVGRAVAAALTIFLVGLPASLAPKILGGYQELKAANVFTSVGSVCNLLSILVLVRLHAGLVALVVASAASYVGANLLCLVWIWTMHKPWLAPRPHHLQLSAAKLMLQTGGEFFLLQIAGLVVFNSDNLVVTHYLGPAEVAPYSVAWRLVGYAAIAQTMLAPALWPAFSEAFARGDYAWVRKTFRQTMAATMGIALLASVVFALFGRWIIRVWASKAAVPSETLMLLMCVWVLLSTFMNNTATVLVAKGETRLQAWLSVVAAIVNLWLSIYLVQKIGTPGVILATIVSYLLILVGPQTWKTFQVLRSKAPLPEGSGAVS
jgi:O-antigen/teichoic acid export membrane protein